jgi:hypothetical protein
MPIAAAWTKNSTFNSAYSALRNVLNIGAKNSQTRRNKKRATTRLRAIYCFD